jgi:hypothetical protein
MYGTSEPLGEILCERQEITCPPGKCLAGLKCCQFRTTQRGILALRPWGDRRHGIFPSWGHESDERPR